MFVAGVSIVGCVYLVARMILRPETDTIFADREVNSEDADTAHGLWPTLEWFAFLLALTSLLGFILALAVFLVSFLRIRAAVSWRFVGIYAASGILFMCALAPLLNRDFPPGLLQELVELPWPLS